MKTLPPFSALCNHIEDSIVSDCCGGPVVRVKDEYLGCTWCGNFCDEDSDYGRPSAARRP